MKTAASASCRAAISEIATTIRGPVRKISTQVQASGNNTHANRGTERNGRDGHASDNGITKDVHMYAT